MDPDGLRQAAGWLRAARKVVVFTGAGVSAESGIPTFRDGGGLWQRFHPMEYATWPGLIKNLLLRPGNVAEFLSAVLEPIVVARPNLAHLTIAALEKHVRTTVVTMNVDGLHQEAGSRCVHEIHGSFFRIVTLTGRPVRTCTRAELQEIITRLRAAREGWFRRSRLVAAMSPMLGLSWWGLRRPSVVLFGAGMAQPDWDNALTAADTCDVLLVVGTSGLVLPAARLPLRAASQGKKVIVIDPHTEDVSDAWLRGPATEVLPLLAREAFREPP